MGAAATEAETLEEASRAAKATVGRAAVVPQQRRKARGRRAGSPGQSRCQAEAIAAATDAEAPEEIGREAWAVTCRADKGQRQRRRGARMMQARRLGSPRDARGRQRRRRLRPLEALEEAIRAARSAVDRAEASPQRQRRARRRQGPGGGDSGDVGGGGQAWAVAPPRGSDCNGDRGGGPRSKGAKERSQRKAVRRPRS